MPVATVIAAIIAAGSSIAAGALSAKSQREANETNLALSEQARQDTLAQNLINNKLNERQIALTEKEANLNRKERTEQKTYDRLQNAANIYTKILNEQTALNNNRLAPIIAGGK